MQSGWIVSVNRWSLIVLLTLLLACGRDAVAGQSGAASIVGQVKDSTGAVLPGVTVTATSPALQVPEITVITDAQGEYRVAPLPIGMFTVAYELPGFSSVRREGIRLTVGFVAKLDIELAVGELAETVTVSGVSPVVDTTSTNTTIQLTQESLDLVPGSRHSVNGMLTMTPGVLTTVDVGGNTADETPRARSFGVAAEPWYVIEGVTTITLNSFGAAGILWDYGAVEESSVQSAGGGVATPTRGVYTTAIVKSGGNTFHGAMSGLETSSKFSSSNLDESLAAQGLSEGNRTLRRYDYAADVGGRIVRDKLWFYSGGRVRGSQDEVPGVFTKPDGSPMTDDSNSWFHTDKVSYQINAANRLIGFVNWNFKARISPTNANLNPYERLDRQSTLGTQSKVEFQTVRNSWMFSAIGGLMQYRSPREALPEGEGKPSFTDLFTLINGGMSLNAGSDVFEKRPQFKVNLTIARPNWFHGDHQLLLGSEFHPTSGGRGNRSRGAAGEYLLQFNRGAAFQIQTFNNPVEPLERTNYLTVYAEDNWSIARRLTLTAGLRFAHDNGFVPDNCRPEGPFVERFCWDRIQFNVWNVLTPRVHASYDVTGMGKTVIKGGYGRFAHMRQFGNEVLNADPMSRVTTTWRWRDLNNNSNYDPGEVNLDPNGPDFVSQSGGTNTIVNPDEIEPMSDEISAAFEHELMENFSLRVTGVQTTLYDPYRYLNILRPPSVYTIPVSRLDPGPDGNLGTADDTGRTLTYYQYPTELRGRAFERFMLTNDSNANQTNRSVEMSAYKRLSNRWQLSASYTLTKKRMPLGGGATYFDSSSLVAERNPNTEINAADNTWEWIGKAQGAYQFPLGLTGSFSFQHLSGIPLARTVLVTGGTTIPSFNVRVDPLGTIRVPTLNLTNLRVVKRFSLGGGNRVGVEVNMYNAFNVNTVTGLTVASGPNFMRPTGVILPRIVDFSASYDF